MIQLSIPTRNLKSFKRRYHSYLWMSTQEVLKAKSLKELLFSKGIQQKNLQKSFANAITSTKKLKRDLNNSFFSKLPLCLLRSRKKVRVITTLLVKITTITTKKKRMRMMIRKQILLREVLLVKLSSIAAILIINFLNYDFTPTTAKMVISEKE